MATPESTEKYFKRLAHRGLPHHAIRDFGRTELKVSSIGFGGYRVHYNSIEHARALRYALLNGINLIDTSSNYTDGGSEMLIGNLLNEMFERRELQPGEAVVVSKVGYVQGQNLELAQRVEAEGRPFPEMVKYLEGCWHCIHPDFLQDQLSRTLERLHLPALDIYLLHNPEYFLSDLKKRGETDVAGAREQYYLRIQKAFEWMEEKVAEGKIRAYGISSNTFPVPASDFEFTSFEKVIAIANYVASDNYFQVIQFPFNLFEAGAALEKNQADGQKTLLELAQENHIAALVNRPLNAMSRGGMVRLASFRETDPDEISKNFGAQLFQLAELESQFQNHFKKKMPREIPAHHLDEIFGRASQLGGALEVFQNWQHWDHVKQNVLMPQAYSYLSYLNHKLAEDAEWQRWSEAYSKTLLAFLDTITRHYENTAQVFSKKISAQLDELCPALKTSETLSQKALRVLTATDGVHCVLLGMRRTPYVEDALAALKSDPIDQAQAVLAGMTSP
jgi:aryl-alcohol dehydrogenase-like predicted oxidoreductase